MAKPSFPGFAHLYLMQDPLSRRPLRGKFDTDADSLAITRGELVPNGPVPVRWAMGGARPMDFVWTTSVHPVIVHRRAVDLLEQQQLTGWSTYAVELREKDGTLSNDYVGLVVLGRCGPVQLSRSVVVLKEYPAGWFPHFLGYYFDEASWDSSAVFMHTPDAAGNTTGHVFVTEALRRVFRHAKVGNVAFERLTNLSLPTSIYEIGSQHLLPDGFSQQVEHAYTRAGREAPP